MLLALLRLVGGLVGGALGGLPAPAGSLTPLWFDAERAIMGGTARLSEDAGLFSPAPGGGAVDGGLDRFGGGADADADVEAGGGGVEVGPARGGGGSRPSSTARSGTTPCAPSCSRGPAGASAPEPTSPPATTHHPEPRRWTRPWRASLARADRRRPAPSTSWTPPRRTRPPQARHPLPRRAQGQVGVRLAPLALHPPVGRPDPVCRAW